MALIYKLEFIISPMYFEMQIFLKSIQNAVCIYTCKIEIKCTLKLSLKTQTFEGKVSAICPSAFLYKRKNCLSIAAVQIWIKAPTIRSFFLKNTDIL